MVETVGKATRRGAFYRNRACAGVGALACGIIGTMVAAGAIASAQPRSLYSQSASVSLGKPDSWDYVEFDPSSGRVYVAHGDKVTVLNGKTGAILGQIDVAPGASHGIAIAHLDGRGYIGAGSARAVTVFDLASLKPVTTIPVEHFADGLAFEPASRRIFVAHADVGKLSVIDPATNRTVGSIDVGGTLEALAAGADGKVYVAGAGNREVVRVDAMTNRVDARWPIPGCKNPHGLAVDKSTYRLFVSCDNRQLVVVDARRGTLIAALAIGRGSDAVAFDEVRRRAFSSNGVDGTISVIQERGANDFRLAGQIATSRTARTLSVDPTSGRLFVPAAGQRSDPSRAAVIVPGSVKLMMFDPTEGTQKAQR